jgi:hypothetical protein
MSASLANSASRLVACHPVLSTTAHLGLQKIPGRVILIILLTGI